MRKLPRTRHLEILVLYLNNHSEETAFGSNKIKEQHAFYFILIVDFLAM